MKTLQHYNIKQLETIIDGILLAQEIENGLDDRYCLGFQVFEFGTFFKVTYSWYAGEVVYFSGDNPEYENENGFNVDSNFKIDKNESIKSFAKSVLNAIIEVTEIEYKN